jgi:hypothetical protein
VSRSHFISALNKARQGKARQGEAMAMAMTVAVAVAGDRKSAV